MPKGKGKGSKEPAAAPPPFVWPVLYRPCNVVFEVEGAENMTFNEFNEKRLAIPWQFRPAMRHSAPFHVELESMRGHVTECLESHRARMEQQRLDEQREKASKPKGRPGSGKPKGGKPNRK